ncbi:uncharacterized protein LOC126828793 isoform X4 [Patella vulgata]|nr:uncharacterized protein LOC126828793 isoform X4 [Patella vulgata]
MEINQGQITLMDILVTLHYSTPRNASPVSFPPTRCDWICKKCGVHNFRRRDVCFKCGLSREDSDRVKTGEGFDEVGLNPCNTLVFRGLDALTTEETLLQTISKHTLLPIKNVCIMRDKATSTSRGYGFAEMNSVSDSSALLEVLTAPTKPPFEVDGKQILVAFAKNTFTTVMATQNQYSAALPPSESKSSYYPSSSNTQHDYSYYNPQSSNTGASTVAVAQAAIQQAHAAQLSHKLDVGSSAVATNWSQNSTTDYPKYPPPDVSTYQYDESSGYYYDPLTNLYYDANTQMRPGGLYPRRYDKKPVKPRLRSNLKYVEVLPEKVYDEVSSDAASDVSSTKASFEKEFFGYDSVSSLEDILSSENESYDDVSSYEDVSSDDEYLESLPGESSPVVPVSPIAQSHGNRSHEGRSHGNISHESRSRGRCPDDRQSRDSRRPGSRSIDTHSHISRSQNARSSVEHPTETSNRISSSPSKNIPSLEDLQRRRRELDLKLEQLDVNFKASEENDFKSQKENKPKDSKRQVHDLKKCPLRKCNTSTRYVRNHVKTIHCPPCIRSKDKNPEVQSNQLHALLFLAKAAKCCSLSSLKEKVNKSGKMTSTLKPQSTDVRVMTNLCKFAGWTVPKEFNLNPMNSCACLIHWRSIGLILNWMAAQDKYNFKKLD